MLKYIFKIFFNCTSDLQIDLTCQDWMHSKGKARSSFPEQPACEAVVMEFLLLPFSAFSFQK